MFHDPRSNFHSYPDTSPTILTIKRKMLVAIIFGGFENITIWLRFNLAISLKESAWGPYFFQLVTTNIGQNLLFRQFRQINLRQIYRFTVYIYLQKVSIFDVVQH